MYLLNLKTLFCLVLILGLAHCQDGEWRGETMSVGSGEGSEEEQKGKVTTVPTYSTSKKVSTFKPDDTIDEFGSGDDDEDRFNATTVRPTTKIVEPDTDDFSGSGSGDLELTTTPSVPEYTKIVKQTEGKEPEILTKRKEPSTKRKVLATKPATTIGNTIAEATEPTPMKTKAPIQTTKNAREDEFATTEFNNGVDMEIIHSPTTASPEKKSTSGNEIPDILNNAFNAANAAARAQKSKATKEDKPFLSFTTGIIIGVVVGAVLALLVILFLVYRLRKKDEGSYSLEEPITGYSKQEPGSPTSEKEYFA